MESIAGVLFEKSLNALKEGKRIVLEFKGEFEKLKRELRLIQSFLRDAEKQQRKQEALRTIMIELRDLIYAAEDILADCEVRSSEGCPDPCSSICFSPSELPFRFRTEKRLKKINERMTDIKQNISSFVGVLPTDNAEARSHNHQMNRWSSSLYDHTLVVGLEADTKMLKDWLFQANRHSLLAIGIVGMGGVGKTTAAKVVFNDRKVEDHFEKRMWVSVTGTLNEEKIMRSMLKNLGDAGVGDNEDQLLKKINQYLQGKRYLLVMDDVWEENNYWWLRISEALPKGNGSSVIITTRKKIVAQKMGVTDERTHRPKFLSEEDSWLLFRKIAFAATHGECENPALVNIGREIVGKCKGLPLAIKAVGGMMLYTAPSFLEWRRIANNFGDELAENDESVKDLLQLSYDELPSYLKSCFLCFSLYPEDCVINKRQLVHWWIGEGLVPFRCGRLETEAGESCFSGLINRCLIEVVDKTYSGKIDTCKMHDLVRDLALRLAKEDAFSVSNGKNFLRFGIGSDMDGSCLQNFSKLRALLSTVKPGEVNKVASSDTKKFCQCRYLRVLDLSKSIFETHLPSLLDKIGSLQHLTYLSLSSTHPLVQIPHSVEKLHNLQIMDLSYCQNLKILPEYITSLEKLIVLDVSHCGSLEYLPKGLGRLSNLQELLGFRPARRNQLDGCHIAELKSMTQLRMLELQITWGDEIGDDEVNTLVDLQQLQFLTINCFDSYGSDIITKLDKLYPPQQLHELCLKFFPGTTSPTWLNPISLPMLQYISILSGNLAKMNQRFWGSIWKVEGIMLESLSDLEEEWVAIQQAMPSLRVARVSWCPKLESFPIADVGFRGDMWKKEEQRR